MRIGHQNIIRMLVSKGLLNRHQATIITKEIIDYLIDETLAGNSIVIKNWLKVKTITRKGYVISHSKLSGERSYNVPERKYASAKVSPVINKILRAR